MDHKAYTVLHRAVQYLATAAKSYVPSRPDDSHTNLGWNGQAMAFSTHDLDDTGVSLQFQVPSFQLQWVRDHHLLAGFDLDGHTHTEIVAWITESAPSVGLPANYTFDLHYEISYPLTPGYRFEKPEAEVLARLVELRSRGSTVLIGASIGLNLGLKPRVWPHHFDTGYLIELDEGRAIGVGMAVPDKLIDDFYLYISGYQGHSYIDNSGMPEIALGKKYDDWWKGYAMPMPSDGQKNEISFLMESIRAYKD